MQRALIEPRAQAPVISAAPSRPMNILVLYHQTQTFTNTVFEHVNAFARFSAHRHFFCHHDESDPFLIDLSRFDAVVIHYCLRMPIDQVSEEAAERLVAFTGPKVLFLQDEYESTHRAWYWIQRLGIDLVFTVVPREHIHLIYPPHQFPKTRFVSNLTGYVPEAISEAPEVTVPSTRPLLIGYRGRQLPISYGALGQEKVGIGRMVKAYCERHDLAHDIAWTEDARIYGQDWYPFVASCRAMLGTESGANVFDWKGDLKQKISAYRESHPQADEEEIYRAVVAPLEMPGLMNQVSPRIFEAIALRTVLVLFEGSYSDVVQPWTHYIPLCKDGSNLDEVFSLLQDGNFVDEMAQRAWRDVIGSNRYSYAAFVSMSDRELERVASDLERGGRSAATAGPGAELQGVRTGYQQLTPVTCLPVRWPQPKVANVPQLVEEEQVPVPAAWESPGRWERLRQASMLVYSCVPRPVQKVMRPFVHGVALPTVRIARRWATGARRRTATERRL